MVGTAGILLRDNPPLKGSAATQAPSGPTT